MNKLLLQSSIDCYAQYDNNKLTDAAPSMYTGTSFYPTPSTYPLPNSPDSYSATKLTHSPASNAIYSVQPPVLFTSISSSTTATTDSSSGTSVNDMMDTNEASTFCPELYTETQPYQDVPYQTSTLSTPLVTSSPMSTSYSGTSSSPRSSISPVSSMPCPTLNLTTPNMKTRSTYQGSVPPQTSHEFEMKSPTNSPHNVSMTDSSNTNMNTTELRRQIHIQSEQKRRAQIKCGFEELRNELPTCLNKKMSKVALLHRTVQHIQHLKSSQITILTELERLVQENEQLKRFQQNILQKPAMENMYSIP